MAGFSRVKIVSPWNCWIGVTANFPEPEDVTIEKNDFTDPVGAIPREGDQCVIIPHRLERGVGRVAFETLVIKQVSPQVWAGPDL